MISSDRKFYFCFLTTMVIILSLFSCVDLIEPDPYTNNDVNTKRIKYKQATLSNYSIDQIVGGKIKVNFIVEENPRLIDSIAVYVDSIRINGVKWNGSWSMSTYDFTIVTNRWLNGKHDIFFYVYKNATLSDSLGLYSLLGNALYIYKTSLIFDNIPLTPENISVTLQGKNAEITWTPSNLDEFTHYSILRDGNVIARINTQNTTTYLDTTLPDFYRGYYQVGTSDGTETVYSSKFNFGKGELLGLTVDNAISNLHDQVIFIQKNNDLVCVSTQTYGVTNQSGNGIHGKWTKNSESDIICCWDYNQNMYTYDVNSLSLVQRQQIILEENSHITSIAISQGDGIFCSINRNNVNDKLYFFGRDETTISVVDRNAFDELPQYTEYISISPDGNNLIVFADNRINKYSLDSRAGKLNLESGIPQGCFSLYVDWENSRIYTTRYRESTMIECWDLHTFSMINYYKFRSQRIASYKVRFRALFANSNYLYAAYSSKELVEFDLSSGQPTRSWKFKDEVWSIYGSENGRYIFACTSTDQWIVDIGGSL